MSLRIVDRIRGGQQCSPRHNHLENVVFVSKRDNLRTGWLWTPAWCQARYAHMKTTGMRLCDERCIIRTGLKSSIQRAEDWRMLGILDGIDCRCASCPGRSVFSLLHHSRLHDYQSQAPSYRVMQEYTMMRIISHGVSQMY